MSIKEILTAIFARIDVKHKWQQDFLLELFDLIYSIQGRLTFENMVRYSIFNECTFRRNFKKFFDWLGFNWQILTWGGLDFSNPVIAAIDCSYLPKAGKSTYGLDKFFSSVAGKAKRGLEISLLSPENSPEFSALRADELQNFVYQYLIKFGFILISIYRGSNLGFQNFAIVRANPDTID